MMTEREKQLTETLSNLLDVFHGFLCSTEGVHWHVEEEIDKARAILEENNETSR